MNLMEIDTLSSDRIYYENENGEEIIPGKHTEIIQLLQITIGWLLP